MFRKKDAEVYYINERSRSASEELASLFSYCIQKDGRMFRELVFLCIGSDRITGDSLGPLIGYQLSPYCSRVFHVYGTLDDPVHALNLPDRISYIHSRHPEALLVAIDASLGSRRHPLRHAASGYALSDRLNDGLSNFFLRYASIIKRLCSDPFFLTG